METQEVIDMGREAIKACLMVGGPILLASLIVGMLIGALQAMTQVPDQSVSFVPKVICLILAIGIALPWLTDRMLDYSREMFSTPITLQTMSPMRAVKFDRTAARNVPAENGPPAPPANDEGNAYPLSKPPFQLPNYRFSRVPQENLDG